MDIWYDGSHTISFYRYNTPDNPIGDFIGNTWINWGLVPNERPFVNPPEQKNSTIEIEGADGVIDMSESLTKWPLYNNRTGQWMFYVTDYNTYEEIITDNNNLNILDYVSEPIYASSIGTWSTKFTKILNALHGKMLIAILDDDQDYYYKGRFKIEQWVSPNDGSFSTVTIKYDLFPYKFKKNFTGIWMNENTSSISIIGGRQPIVPYIYTKRKNENTNGNIVLEFINPELGIHHTDISWSNNTRRYDLMENMGIGLKDCVITNLSGANACTLSVTNIDQCDYVYLRYREGEL